MTVVKPIGHEDRLSLVEHLDELRTRLVVCIAAFFVCFGFAYWQNDTLLDIINRPLEQTQNLDGKDRSNDPLEQAVRFELRVGEFLNATAPAIAALRASVDELRAEGRRSAPARAALERSTRALERMERATRQAARSVPTNRERQPVTLGVAEPFVTTFTVSAYAALLLALPLLLYQAYAFVLPAFSPTERRVALPLMALAPVLFIGGVAFAYFVALPRAVDFLQNFNDDAFDILIGAKDFYRFSIMFLLVFGLLFQIPIGVIAVTRLGIVSTATLRRNRGYILLATAVVAAVATPTPDPVTMVLAMAPLVILFELSVQLARVFEGRGSRWEWDDEDDDDGARERGEGASPNVVD